MPAQTDGRPFYDGTEDALNFFLSTASRPYAPVPSCTTGTSHADKQRTRAAQGLVTGYNPFWQLLDRSRIGLAGHSYGAAGVSYIAQWDPRVSAVVAWDNLGGPSPTGGSIPGSGAKSTIGEQPCPADPAARTAVPIRKPGLGISADYGLPPTPNTSQPDPGAKSVWSHAYTAGRRRHRRDRHPRRVAPGLQLHPDRRVRRLAARSRCHHLVHDGVVRQVRQARPDAPTGGCSPTRWRSDAAEAAVDPDHDGNAFSFYYPSRLDIRLAGGTRWDCENLRSGCSGMTAHDGVTGSYSYLATDTTPDAATGPGSRIHAPGPNSIYLH